MPSAMDGIPGEATTENTGYNQGRYVIEGRRESLSGRNTNLWM